MIKSLHHIGIASKNIARDVLFFKSLGYESLGALREDLQAQIKVQFMRGKGQPNLELVQNLEKDGPVTPHLQAKRKIFHFAYECDDIENDAAKFMEENAGIFLVPITYVDDENSDIKSWCYIACRNSMIVELLELRR